VAFLVVERGVRNGVVVVEEWACESGECSQIHDVAGMHHPGVAPKVDAFSVNYIGLMEEMGS